jgi:hypothetical protein
MEQFTFSETLCVLFEIPMAFLYTLFTLCHFVTKRGIFFVFGPGMYF